MMPLLGQVWMGWKQSRTECVLGTFQLKAQRSRAGVLVIDHILLYFQSQSFDEGERVGGISKLRDESFH